MSRRYGRATPGHRVVDHVPANYGINYTMLAALGGDGLEAPWVVDGAVNGDIFRWWVRHVLCPTLQPGDIMRWDNPTTLLNELSRQGAFSCARDRPGEYAVACPPRAVGPHLH
jgi:hypothetical protein